MIEVIQKRLYGRYTGLINNCHSGGIPKTSTNETWIEELKKNLSENMKEIWGRRKQNNRLKKFNRDLQLSIMFQNKNRNDQ